MIKSGNFTENLYYNNPANQNTTTCFNGNISNTSWTYNGAVRTYNHYYDPLNRLASSVIFQYTNGYISGTSDEESFTYDKLGNITYLKRQKGTTNIDGLTMAYNGNQVTKVTDANGSQNQAAVKEYNDAADQPVEFTYDQNGNMKKDLDRNIVTIRYNILNLPDTIQFKNGNQIINLYAADGRNT